MLEPTKEKLLTVKEAARLIGVTEGRICQLLRSGSMRGIKVNQKAWLVPESEIKKFQTPLKRGRPRSGPVGTN